MSTGVLPRLHRYALELQGILVLPVAHDLERAGAQSYAGHELRVVCADPKQSDQPSLMWPSHAVD